MHARSTFCLKSPSTTKFYTMFAIYLLSSEFETNSHTKHSKLISNYNIIYCLWGRVHGFAETQLIFGCPRFTMSHLFIKVFRTGVTMELESACSIRSIYATCERFGKTMFRTILHSSENRHLVRILFDFSESKVKATYICTNVVTTKTSWQYRECTK